MRSSNKFGGYPVGSVAQFAYGAPSADWLYCDCSKISKATYAVLAALYPTGCGTFTVTARTPSSTSASNGVASDGAQWAVAGAAGTSAILTTPDGVAYTARTTPASTSVRSILHLTTTNWVAAVTGSAQPLYSADSAATWTAATGATTAAAGAMQNCMSYAPSIGANGRICMAAGTATVYTSDDLGHTYTARATGLGFNVFNITHDGTYYLATTSSTTSIGRSADGITWENVTMPFIFGAAVVGQSYIAADTSGNSVISFNSGALNFRGLVVSHDHFATCNIVALPTYGTVWLAGYLSGSVSYTNGRFMLAGYAALHCSVDLKSWINIPYMQMGGNWNIPTTYSYRSAGVYYICRDASATHHTIVEDTTMMYLPGQLYADVSSDVPAQTHPQYIKVR